MTSPLLYWNCFSLNLLKMVLMELINFYLLNAHPLNEMLIFWKDSGENTCFDDNISKNPNPITSLSIRRILNTILVFCVFDCWEQKLLFQWNKVEIKCLNIESEWLNRRARRTLPEIMSKEAKASMTLVFLMGAFLICWLPFFIWMPLVTVMVGQLFIIDVEGRKWFI